MELKDIMIKIGNYDDTINEIFPNKDYITIDDLVGKVEDLYCEVDSLKEELERKNHKYDEWDDYDDHEDEYKELYR